MQKLIKKFTFSLPDLSGYARKISIINGLSTSFGTIIHRYPMKLHSMFSHFSNRDIAPITNYKINISHSLKKVNIKKNSNKINTKHLKYKRVELSDKSKIELQNIFNELKKFEPYILKSNEVFGTETNF